MKLVLFEKQVITSLLSDQFPQNTLTIWVDGLDVVKRDFNGYGYYLYFREFANNSLGKIIKPNGQKPTQGSYFENFDKHDIGFILWMNENGEHSLECYPYDDKPIKQSILRTEVSIHSHARRSQT